jgi:hypothetical protein
MKKKLFNLYCFYPLLSLFFLSCINSEKKANTLSPAQFYIPLKEKDTQAIKKFDDFFNNSSIIYLSSLDSSLIASVSKVLVYEGKFFILDKKFSSLTCFDKKGNPLITYGRLGLGEKEFKKIDDFDIDSTKNQVIIFSNEDLSLYYYSLDKGIFIKKKYIGLYANSIIALPSNEVMLYVGYRLNRKMFEYNLLIIDSNANVVNRFLPFNSKLSSFGWSFTGFLTKSYNQIFFTDAFNDSVFSYQEQNFSLFSYININSESIEKNKLDHNKLLNSKIILDSATSFLKSQFFRNDNYIIFNYQLEKRTKVAFYKIKDKSINVLTAKNADDPLLILARNLMYLDNNNNLVFAISPNDVCTLKEKEPGIFEKLPTYFKNKFNNTNAQSNFYLLITHIKT